MSLPYFCNNVSACSKGACDPFWALCFDEVDYPEDETLTLADTTVGGQSYLINSPENGQRRSKGDKYNVSHDEERVRQYFLGRDVESDDEDDHRVKKTFRRRRKKLHHHQTSAAQNNSIVEEEEIRKNKPNTIFVQKPLPTDDNLILPPQCGAGLKQNSDKYAMPEMSEEADDNDSSTLGSSDDNSSALTSPSVLKVPSKDKTLVGDQKDKSRDPPEEASKAKNKKASQQSWVSDGFSTIAAFEIKATSLEKKETSAKVALTPPAKYFTETEFKSVAKDPKEARIKSAAKDPEETKRRGPTKRGLFPRPKKEASIYDVAESETPRQAAPKRSIRGFGTTRKSIERGSFVAEEQELQAVKAAANDMGKTHLADFAYSRRELLTAAGDVGRERRSIRRYSKDNRLIEEKPGRRQTSSPRRYSRKEERSDRDFDETIEHNYYGRQSEVSEPYVRASFSKLSLKQKLFDSASRKSKSMSRQQKGLQRPTAYELEPGPRIRQQRATPRRTIYEPEPELCRPPAAISDLSRRELELRSIGALDNSRWVSAPRLGGRGVSEVDNYRYPRSTSRGRESSRERVRSGYVQANGLGARGVPHHQHTQRYESEHSSRYGNEFTDSGRMLQRPKRVSRGPSRDFVDLSDADHGMIPHSLPVSLQLELGARVARNKSEKLAIVGSEASFKWLRSLSAQKSRYSSNIENAALLSAGSFRL